MWYFESSFQSFLDSIPQIISFLIPNNFNVAKLEMKPKRKQMANTVAITLLTVSSDFLTETLEQACKSPRGHVSFLNRWEMPSLKICSEHRTRVWPNGFHRGDEMTKVSEHLTSWGLGVCRIWIVTCRINRASPEKTAAAVCVRQHGTVCKSPPNCPRKVKPPHHSISLALTKKSHSSSHNTNKCR